LKPTPNMKKHTHAFQNFKHALPPSFKFLSIIVIFIQRILHFYINFTFQSVVFDFIYFNRILLISHFNLNTLLFPIFIILTSMLFTIIFYKKKIQK